MAGLRSVLGLVLLLAACAPRGDFTPAPSGAGSAMPEAIFVGTTRMAGPQGFGRDRAIQPSFLRYDISIPQNRSPPSPESQ